MEGFGQFNFLLVLPGKQLALLGVGSHGLQHGRVRMAQQERSLAEGEVEVFVTVHVINPASQPVGVGDGVGVVILTELRRNAPRQHASGAFEQGCRLCVSR